MFNDKFFTMRKHLYTLFLLTALAPWPARAQDPDLEADERAAMEEYFRTSEQPGETPVNARKRRGHGKRVSVPAGAVRVGCVCMDDSRSDTRSIGACSGHGGVRYWLYRTREGDTVRVLTARHEQHPHPLDSAERSALVPPGRSRRDGHAHAPVPYAAPSTVIYVQPLQPDGAAPEPDTDWPEVAGLTAGGILSLLAMRLLLGWADKHIPFLSDALRYLLRSRKRPPSRKDR